jgi:hypothetical protein
MRTMWEYVSMWHKANWISNGRADGWKEWVMAPADTPGPQPDASDSEALNVMGRQGWELVETEIIWDMPAGGRNPSDGAQSRRYLFKRPVR